MSSLVRSLCLAGGVIALLLATDLGMGVPMEMILAACLTSLRMAEALGGDEVQLRQGYYPSPRASTATLPSCGPVTLLTP